MSEPPRSDIAAELEDEIDIEVRPALDVATRAIILAAVIRRLGLERGPLPPEERAAEAFDLREWLRDQGLLDAASPGEIHLLRRPLDSLNREEEARWSWQTVALEVIAWALGLTQLEHDRTAPDLEDVLSGIPVPWESTVEWIRQTTILPEEAIATERERADIWHWRATTEALRRESTANRGDIEAAIADVVAESVAGGLVARLTGDDFSVEGESVRELSPGHLDDLQTATAERLRALNWLCGFGRNWDEVPLDI